MPTQFLYQWQNPELRATIYPFREKKLRDFLLIYKEIDWWKAMRNAPVNPAVAGELSQEYARIKSAIAAADLQKNVAKDGLKVLQAKYRETLNRPDVRQLAQQKVNLQMKISGFESKKKTLERQVAWYQKFAPEHPYFDKFTHELDMVNQPYQELQAQLQAVVNNYNQALAPFEAESKSLNDSLNNAIASSKSLTESLRLLPPLDKTGQVSRTAAVRWQLQKYGHELEQLSHDQLLSAVVERFEKEPGRFPKWLQYMVIHFSGMRYKSAHGSWADARDLYEMLQVEAANQSAQAASPADLDTACAQEIASLQKARLAIADPVTQRQLDNQVTQLSNPLTRKTALAKIRAARAVDDVAKLNEQDILTKLAAMKDQFPEWAWKEIVARTDLKVNFAEENWEDLTPEERQERWSAEDQKWRQMMDFWERKDITAWRQEHEATLGLVVTRAVCNEVAEHIQHLRGIKPAAGLAAKPQWYLKRFRSAYGASPRDCNSPADMSQDRPFFTSPWQMKRCDFKAGASILFLGWVESKPNPWQIAHPLDGINLLPPEASRGAAMPGERPAGPGDGYKYANSGDAFIRTTTLPGGKGEGKGIPVTEWLRWTHEATVVEVAEMADGQNYVLTFETGQIGLNLRPLGRMLNHWDIYVGYTPAQPADLHVLDQMVDPGTLFPAGRPVAAEPAPSFAVPSEAIELPREAGIRRRDVQEVARLWDCLTPRERQIAALVSHGFTPKEIAGSMQVTPGTVNRHLRQARRKFGVKNLQELKEALELK